MKLSGRVSLCRTCGEVFSSPGTFDRHRVGRYDLAAPHYGRRCRSTAELEAAGWIRNAAGRWSAEKMPAGLFRKRAGDEITQGSLPHPGGTP